MSKAVEIAIKSESKGNLPIGAVITYNNEIISTGENNIYSNNPISHAEILAINNIPNSLKSEMNSMTLYTTLEPCLMCFSAICLCNFKKVYFGANDGYGGFSNTSKFPTFFNDSFSDIEIAGPVLPEICDELYMKSLRKLGVNHRR